MNLNKLLTILIIIAVLLLLLRLGSAVIGVGITVIRVAFRFWYITIPVLLLIYWRPKKRKKDVAPNDNSLDPSKEIKPPTKPIIKNDDEADDK